MIWQSRGSAFVHCVLHSLTIISHPFRFVKRFLKSFLKTFLTSPQAVGGSALTLYHTLLRLSRSFSKVFSTFFAIFCLAVLAVARSLSAAVCQPLFDSRCLTAAVWQLAYYSTFISICQPFFDKFFRFGEGGNRVQNTDWNLCTITNKWLVMIPKRVVRWVNHAHFPQLEIFKAAIRV